MKMSNGVRSKRAQQANVAIDPLGSRDPPFLEQIVVAWWSIVMTDGTNDHSRPATSAAIPTRPVMLSSRREAAPVNCDECVVVGLGLPVEPTTLVPLADCEIEAVDRHGSVAVAVEVDVTVVVLLEEATALTADAEAAAWELEMMAAQVSGSRPLGQQLPLLLFKQKDPLGQAHELAQQV